MSIAGLDYPEFADTFLWIKDKRGRIIPFIRNDIQKKCDIIMNERQRYGDKFFIILKYRRGGITTDQQGKNFFTALHSGKSVVTLAHEKEDTQKIFNMARMFYNRLEPSLQPNKSRKIKKELEFPDLNSEYYIGTAGAKAFGRGSTLHRFHASEVAFWPGSQEQIDNLIASLCEAGSHGVGVLESTANGAGNWFHEKWLEVKDGLPEWHGIFLPWFEDSKNIVPCISDDEAVSILENLQEGEEFLVDKFGLNSAQLKWRRKTKGRLRRLFTQEYPEDDLTAFLVSGTSFFDIPLLNELIAKARVPVTSRWRGRLKIWETPIPGEEYVAGSDCSAGIDDDKHDASVTTIIKKSDGTHVATLTCKFKPYEFAVKSHKLVVKYNNAEWGIERNEHGHAVLNTVINIIKYRNVYRHEKYDRATRQKTRQHGWPTNSETRPIMIDDLAEALEKGSLKTNDVDFLGECRTFVMKKKRYEASHGNHDDRLMSMAIAWQVRKRRSRAPGLYVSSI